MTTARILCRLTHAAATDALALIRRLANMCDLGDNDD